MARIRLRSIAMMLAFAVIMAVVTACGAPSDQPASVLVEKLDMPGIENFSRLEDSSGFAGSPVGIGGATQSSAMRGLKSAGFAAVINLRLATEEGADIDASHAAAAEARLAYIHLPFNPGTLDSQFVDMFLTAAADSSNQPVYIHCGSGTRAAALWMIARVLADGWEIDAAREEAEAIALKPDAAVSLATGYLAAHGN